MESFENGKDLRGKKRVVIGGEGKGKIERFVKCDEGEGREEVKSGGEGGDWDDEEMFEV